MHYKYVSYHYCLGDNCKKQNLNIFSADEIYLWILDMGLCEFMNVKPIDMKGWLCFIDCVHQLEKSSSNCHLGKFFFSYVFTGHSLIYILGSSY